MYRAILGDIFGATDDFDRGRKTMVPRYFYIQIGIIDGGHVLFRILFSAAHRRCVRRGQGRLLLTAGCPEGG